MGGTARSSVASDANPLLLDLGDKELKIGELILKK